MKDDPENVSEESDTPEELELDLSEEEGKEETDDLDADSMMEELGDILSEEDEGKPEAEKAEEKDVPEELGDILPEETGTEEVDADSIDTESLMEEFGDILSEEEGEEAEEKGMPEELESVLPEETGMEAASDSIDTESLMEEFGDILSEEGGEAEAEEGEEKDILEELEDILQEEAETEEVEEEEALDEFETLLPKEVEEETAEELEEVAPPTKLGFLAKLSAKEEKFEMEPYDPEKHGPLAVFEGVEGYVEVERYWVTNPYAFVVILYSEDENEHIYHVVEPKLTDFEATFLNEMKRRIQDMLLVEPSGVEGSREEIVRKKSNEIIADYGISIDPVSYYKVLYYIERDYVHVGKLSPVMNDTMIEDISCNGWDTPIFLYHKNYTNIQTSIIYDEAGLNSFVIRLAQESGKHISVAEPMVDASMPDGSRIQMTLGDEITTHGSTFTIRKFKDVPLSPIDLIRWNTFSAEVMAYLWLCIENNKSLIFAGGTASGKTTSVNAIALFIPPKAKVVTLEDTREVQLPHINWIPGLTRDAFTADGGGAVDMYELLRAALRQRPEYIVVGEVRGKEALTLFQAMSTGHTTYSTMHADSIDSAIHRLENPPIDVPRTMIQALDIMCIQAQTYSKSKRVRRNTVLVEISDVDAVTKAIKTIDIFKWDAATDLYPNVGISQALEDIRQRRAWTQEELKKQLKERQMVLEYMVNNDITDYKEVASIIHAFQAKPEKVIEDLKLYEEPPAAAT